MNSRNLRWLLAGFVIAVAAAVAAALVRHTRPSGELTAEAAEAGRDADALQPAAP